MKSEILKVTLILSQHHNQWYARKLSVWGRLEEKITCLSGQQTAACQVLITISFSLGGFHSKLFPLETDLIYLFVSCSPPNWHIYGDFPWSVRWQFPGVLAEQQVYWREEYNFFLCANCLLLKDYGESCEHFSYLSLSKSQQINIDWNYFLLLHTRSTSISLPWKKCF